MDFSSISETLFPTNLTKSLNNLKVWIDFYTKDYMYKVLHSLSVRLMVPQRVSFFD